MYSDAFLVHYFLAFANSTLSHFVYDQRLQLVKVVLQMKWFSKAPPPPPTDVPLPPPPPPKPETWWDVYGPPSWSVLFHEVSLNEYPWLARTPYMTTYPGMTLLELSMLRGVRYCALTGFALSPLVWLYRRKRLPFAERPLCKMHHYFFPSAGYSTASGIVGGIGECLYTARRDIGPAHPDKATEVKLVKTAVSARVNKENDRWCRSAGRFSSFGIVSTVLFWKSGSLPFRIAMGLGCGVCVGAVVSALRIDLQMDLIV